MARELTPAAPGPDLTHQLAITPEQDAAVRRLVGRRPRDQHDGLLEALGLNDPIDQP